MSLGRDYRAARQLRTNLLHGDGNETRIRAIDIGGLVRGARRYRIESCCRGDAAARVERSEGIERAGDERLRVACGAQTKAGKRATAG